MKNLKKVIVTCLNKIKPKDLNITYIKPGFGIFSNEKKILYFIETKDNQWYWENISWSGRKLGTIDLDEPLNENNEYQSPEDFIKENNIDSIEEWKKQYKIFGYYRYDCYYCRYNL